MDDRDARDARNGHIPAADGDGHSGPEPAGLAALIREAESLHASLGEGRARLFRLIAGLRRHRRQTRLLADAVKSIRQLNLAGPVE